MTQPKPTNWQPVADNVELQPATLSPGVAEGLRRAAGALAQAVDAWQDNDEACFDISETWPHSASTIGRAEVDGLCAALESFVGEFEA